MHCSSSFFFGNKQAPIDAVCSPSHKGTQTLVGRRTHACKSTHKSNTLCISQEIIAVINIQACSLVTSLIG